MWVSAHKVLLILGQTVCVQTVIAAFVQRGGKSHRWPCERLSLAQYSAI